jgi:hypothetical protein
MYTITHAQSTHTTTHATTTTGGSTSTERLGTLGKWWITSAASTALNWTSQVVVGGVLCTAGCWWCLLNAWERRQITSAASTALIEPHRKLILFCFVYTLERWWITSVVSTAYNSILQVVDCIVLCTLYRWWITSVTSTAFNSISQVVDCIVLCTLYRWWMTSVASTALNYTSHT